jgi:hypothetical protein
VRIEGTQFPATCEETTEQFQREIPGHARESANDVLEVKAVLQLIINMHANPGRDRRDKDASNVRFDEKCN